jgi:hypothetical protein
LNLNKYLSEAEIKANLKLLCYLSKKADQEEETEETKAFYSQYSPPASKYQTPVKK